MPTRRGILRHAAGAGLLALVPPLERAGEAATRVTGTTGLRQSVCRWPFTDMPDADFFPMVKALGFGAVDLLTEKE